MPKAAKLTKDNVQWGICGFASSLAGIYKTDKAIQAKIKSVKDEDITTRMLAEIKTYLVTLKADESPILDDIVSFTRSFKGYEKFKVDDYIKLINASVAAKNVKDYDFSIGLPPNAVVDYLERMWEKTGLSVVSKNGSNLKKDVVKLKNVILGLYDKEKGNLGHWVFMKDVDTVYNWGKTKSLDEVLTDCEDIDASVICCYIKL